MKMEFKSGNVEATRALSTGYISTGMKPTMTAALDLQAGEKGRSPIFEHATQAVNPQRARRVSVTVTLLMTLTLGIALAAPVSTVVAQTRYSVEGANHFVRAKDWNGLSQYATAWTKAEPNNPLAWYYLGNNYATGLQQPEASIPAFQQVVRLDPNRHGAWQTLGVQYMKVKRFEDAVNAFKRATEIDPRKPNYWNNLASAYRETRQFDLAVAALDSNMKLAAPHGNWADWHNLGTAYRNLGLMWGNERDRQNKAIITFRQSLKLNPKNHDGWNSLGATYQTLGNYDEAFRCYKQAESLGNTYARNNYDTLKAAIAAAARAAANMGSDGSSSGGSGSGCSSYSGPVAAACNQGDRGAMDRYQSHQQNQEDKRKYGVQ
jgi:tetratricopeptide (TPR) repeat protein